MTISGSRIGWRFGSLTWRRVKHAFVAFGDAEWRRRLLLTVSSAGWTGAAAAAVGGDAARLLLTVSSAGWAAAAAVVAGTTVSSAGWVGAAAAVVGTTVSSAGDAERLRLTVSSAGWAGAAAAVAGTTVSSVVSIGAPVAVSAGCAASTTPPLAPVVVGDAAGGIEIIFSRFFKSVVSTFFARISTLTPSKARS